MKWKFPSFPVHCILIYFNQISLRTHINLWLLLEAKELFIFPKIDFERIQSLIDPLLSLIRLKMLVLHKAQQNKGSWNAAKY